MRQALPAILLVLLVAGCGGDEGKPIGGVQSSHPISRSVVVTRDNRTLPESCRAESVGGLAVRFADALNRADQRQLMRIWSGRFEWFSVTGSPGVASIGVPVEGRRRHFVAYTAQDALRYVGNSPGLHMRLEELVVSGRARSGGVDVFYGGAWTEPTVGERREFGLVGKGFVNCGGRSASPSIRVWSMAVHGRPAQSKACGDPGRRHRDLVACWQPE